jgi:cellulose synthase operon protein B
LLRNEWLTLLRNGWLTLLRNGWLTLLRNRWLILLRNTHLHANRWDSSRKLLISWPGNWYELALDNYAWGFCALEDFPVEVLDKTSLFRNTQTATVSGFQVTGYSPDIDKDVVWLEGTGEMTAALNKAGRESTARFYLQEMHKSIILSSVHKGTKGLPYVTNPGTSYGDDALWPGAETKPCISSSAWFIFGVIKFDPFLRGYAKGVPQEDKFWMN